MKKLGLTVLIAIGGAWLLISLARDFFDSVAYFSAQPHRLLYVVAVAIVGGLASFAFARLSRLAQRRIRSYAWGAAASALSLCIVYMVIRLILLFSIIVESGMMIVVLLALLLFTAAASYFWFEYFRARGEERSS